ncbi:FecR domain-containing protein [Sphingorhabdus sp. Alg239-R122]|uniref:FecR domain-containing protein n=1 Tax=Sphingorhabdus sp. Alg239-R122 TaxID=2305989 RepID=UPI0013DC9A56|nr:FecR domain-containing protein [Sphingorhabdus sp. Alg239-R122]
MHKSLSNLTFAWLLLTALVLPQAASAKEAASDTEIIYVFKQNDTVSALAKRYFQASKSYNDIIDHNGIRNDRAIPVGFKLKIPHDYLKYTRSSGTVRAFRGDVAIAAKNKPTRNVSVGMSITEGDILATNKASSLSLAFADGSIVTMPSNSVIRVTRLRKILLTESIDYEFALDRGGIRSKVTPFRNRQDRYRTRTPISVSAVRGTDFRNRYDPETGSSFAELVEGALDVTGSDTTGALTLEPGFGAAIGAQSLAKLQMLPAPELASGTGLQKREFVTFKLRDNDTAQAYRVQLSRDAGFIEIVDDMQVSDNKIAIANVDNGNYFAKFTAYGQNGLEGLPTTIAFKRRLNTVKASADISEAGYSFRWQGTGKGRRVYQFQLYRVGNEQALGNFTPTGAAMIEQSGFETDGLTLSDLPEGRYFWRVGTQLFIDSEMDESWTDFKEFTVG